MLLQTMHTEFSNLRKHEIQCFLKRYNKRLSAETSYPDGRQSTSETECTFCHRKFTKRLQCVAHMKKCKMGGVRSTPKQYNYRCLSCNQEFKDRIQKTKHYPKCVGSRFDHLVHKFMIVKTGSFKNTSFEYSILPKDNYIAYLTNLSLWNMILQMKQVIEFY